jgi:Ca2+/H+ antiporter, TMEM165/GDT1 family
MEALFSSFLMVAISEMGDKTQLLALVLMLRFRRPWVIMGGILAATLLNHGLAAWAGGWVAQLVAPTTLRYILAALFFVFALWILIPDKEDDDDKSSKYGAFLTTLVTFFLAEMGDKTQLATIALGARFQAPVVVTMGTTLGMLLADGLAVFFGESLTKKIPLKYVRIAAAVLFAAFGATILASSGA